VKRPRTQKRHVQQLVMQILKTVRINVTKNLGTRTVIKTRQILSRWRKRRRTRSVKERFVRCAVETTPRTKMDSQRFLFIVPSAHPVVSNSIQLCTWNYRIKEELNAVAVLTTLQRLVVVRSFKELAFYVRRSMKHEAFLQLADSC
jgi:hypothetical protein